MHTDRFLVALFHKYGFKDLIFVKDLKLWLFEMSKTLFYIGQRFDRSEKIRQGGATIPKQLK